MKVDCVIGIDPGKSGGIAIYKPNQPLKTIKMPSELMDFKDFFEQMKDLNPIVFLEKVQLQHGDLSDGKAFRIQVMLKDFEKLKTILEMCQVPFILVHPMTWQSGLKLRLKGEEKPARKKRYQAISQKIYPEQKSTLWNADAIMIMHFGRYALQNRVNWIFENLPSSNHHKIL